jgi:hypothetical protein
MTKVFAKVKAREFEEF